MFQRHIWVCSLCGQGLTRKSSANRHNNSLHSGQAGIVRPYEYIIRRLNGNFHSPKDPLSYRHRKENGQQDPNGNNNDFTSKVIADSTQQVPKANNANNTSSKFPVQSTPKTGDNKLPSSLDYSEKMLEQRLKLEEFNILLNKHSQQDNARGILAMATFLVNQGDEKFLDKKLEWLRRLDRIRSGSGSSQAMSFNNVTN
ncbi:MAG: hypothetical protein WAM14_06800 [Candidatus Nitrosopolaris sp.]